MVQRAGFAMISVIIPAAGQSSRMGGTVSKQFMKLGDHPVLVHTLLTFQTLVQITEIIVVCRTNELVKCQELLKQYSLDKIKAVIPGGTTRQESVYNGICQVSEDSKIIVVHDGARPFVTHDIICQCIEAAKFYGAACAAVKVKDTIKTASMNEFVQETLDRSLLWSIQTPQAFDTELLKHAYENAIQTGFLGTDDCMLVEKLGHKVKLVESDYENIKITTPVDFIVGDSILKSRYNNTKNS
jgi:2-C-methyl-D-erythritol 4-phosphate cytidylyltransferase